MEQIVWECDSVSVRSCYGYVDEVDGIRGTPRKFEYPDPPTVFYSRAKCTGQHHPEAPGVYFAFDKMGRCKYVGQARNLKRRLVGHPVIDAAWDFVGWIEFPAEMLNYAESYYIGLLRPYANFCGEFPEDSGNPFEFGLHAEFQEDLGNPFECGSNATD